LLKEAEDNGVELPFKRYRQTPELSAEAAAYKAKVRESLDTQVSELKKYRETKWKPKGAELEEKEKEVREKKKELEKLEKERKKVMSQKDRMRGEMAKLQAEIDSTRARMNSIV
jgi:chromosome segregation ATPase